MKGELSPVSSTILIIGFTIVLAALVISWSNALFEEKPTTIPQPTILTETLSWTFTVCSTRNRPEECSVKDS